MAQWTNFRWIKTNYLWVAGFKNITHDDATLFLSPSLSVGVEGTWIPYAVCIRAARGIFPAVSKVQGIVHFSLVPQSEVVLCIAIIGSAKSTHFTLLQKIRLAVMLKNIYSQHLHTEQDSTFNCLACVDILTLYSGLSLMNMLVFRSHIRISPLLASITR